MLGALSVLAVAVAFYVLIEWWIAHWASSDVSDQDDLHWIWVLVTFTCSGISSNVISVVALFILLLSGSTRLHTSMLKTVLHSPLKFFHTNPTGRILNRFSKDMGMQDEDLPWFSVEVITVSQLNCSFRLVTFSLLQNVFVAVSTVCLVCIALPYMLIFFVAISFIFRYYLRHYVVTSREVKRFDGITRSPVYAIFSENIKGLSTIRAYNSQEDFHSRFMESLDLNGSWLMAFLLTSRWIGYRLDGISASVMLFSVTSAIILAKSVGSVAITN